MTESCRLSRRQALLSTAALVPILGACGAKELGGSPTPTRPATYFTSGE